jgi:hypothetical protein
MPHPVTQNIRDIVRDRIVARYLSDFPEMSNEEAALKAFVGTVNHSDEHLADMLAELDRQAAAQ